jgi:hypothetical protein
MDKLEKSHEETKIFCPLTPTLIQPACPRQDYSPHPKLIVVPSIQFYVIVLEFGLGESRGLEGFKSLHARSG